MPGLVFIRVPKICTKTFSVSTKDVVSRDWGNSLPLAMKKGRINIQIKMNYKINDNEVSGKLHTVVVDVGCTKLSSPQIGGF